MKILTPDNKLLSIDEWASEQQTESTSMPIPTDLDYRQLTAIAADMHMIAAAHGFHDGETTESAAEIPRVAMFVANLHGECSELWEAARKGKLFEGCDKSVDLSCAEEELADIVIRAMDMAHAIGIDLGDAVKRKAEYNSGREHMHGKKV